MADLSLYCNFKKCQKRLTHFAWVTRCSHAFCDEDGKKEFLRDSDGNITQRKCPACGMLLEKQLDIIKVDLDPSEEFKSMVLAGLRPDIAADIMSRSLTFWNYQIYQQQLFHEASSKQVRNSLSEVEKYYESVVHKIQNTLVLKEQKLKENQLELDAQIKLNEELKERLNAKTRQAQKAQQQFDTLRRNTLSASISNNIEESRQNQHEDVCNSHHNYYHQKVNPPGFPFIHPQPINKANPLLMPRSNYDHNMYEANHGLQDFNFKPVTPVGLGQSSARSLSKRPRVTQSQTRRPHN